MQRHHSRGGGSNYAAFRGVRKKIIYGIHSHGSGGSGAGFGHSGFSSTAQFNQAPTVSPGGLASPPDTVWRMGPAPTRPAVGSVHASGMSAVPIGTGTVPTARTAPPEVIPDIAMAEFDSKGNILVVARNFQASMPVIVTAAPLLSGQFSTNIPSVLKSVSTSGGATTFTLVAQGTIFPHHTNVTVAIISGIKCASALVSVPSTSEDPDIGDPSIGDADTVPAPPSTD